MCNRACPSLPFPLQARLHAHLESFDSSFTLLRSSTKMPRRPLTLIILFALGLFIFITLLNGFSEHPSISPYLSSSSSTCDWGRHDSSSACREASRNAIRHIATQLIGLQSGHKLEHSCTTKAFGSGWGEHSLCDKRPLRVDRPCVFYCKFLILTA